MRGAVICELIEEFERRLGVVGAERILASMSPPPSQVYAAYVEVPAAEFDRMVEAAQAHGLERDPLLRAVGARLMRRLLEVAPHTTHGCDTALDFYDRLPRLIEVWSGESQVERPRLSPIGCEPNVRRFAYVNAYDGVLLTTGALEEAARVFGDTVEVTVSREPCEQGFSAVFDIRRIEARAA